MFTGLIEEIGVIKSIRSIGGGKKITVEANKILDDLKIDDSVALNGACQTVVAINGNQFDVEAVEETLIKTTLSGFISGKKINLERAAKLGDRLGGHLVQGHVDTVGTVASIEKLSTGVLIWISFDRQFDKYMVNTGSICIDGVSLTSARVESSRFMVSIIPHTFKMTTLSMLSPGDKVNLEFDIIGKYIDKMISIKQNKESISFWDNYKDQPEF